MAVCRYCHSPISWGDENGKWVKLVPVDQHDGMDRSFQDENGILRARHTCAGWEPAVKIERLAVPIPGDQVLPTSDAGKKPPFTIKQKRKKRVRKDDYVDDSIPF